MRVDQVIFGFSKINLRELRALIEFIADRRYNYQIEQELNEFSLTPKGKLEANINTITRIINRQIKQKEVLEENRNELESSLLPNISNNTSNKVKFLKNKLDFKIKTYGKLAGLNTELKTLFKSKLEDIEVLDTIKKIEANLNDENLIVVQEFPDTNILNLDEYLDEFIFIDNLDANLSQDEIEIKMNKSFQNIFNEINLNEEELQIKSNEKI